MMDRSDPRWQDRVLGRLVVLVLVLGASSAFAAGKDGVAESAKAPLAVPSALTGAAADSARIARAAAFAFVDSLVLDGSVSLETKTLLLERLLEQNPGVREPWTYRAADHLGRLAIENGDRTKAIAYLELAVEGRGEDADLLNTLGYLYAEENTQLDRAEELVRKALSVTPADTREEVLGFYHDSLGWVLFRKGKPEAAVPELELAMKQAPDTPEIRSHLVDVYEALDRVEDGSRILAEDLVAARGLDPELRARLRRLNHTTPIGKPLPIEVEVDQKVIARDVAELEATGGSILRLQSQDGFPLVATYYPAGTGAKGKKPKKSANEATTPAVILVPMFGGSRADYDSLARKLAQAGIGALALDPRGHGASVTNEVWSYTLFRADLSQFVQGAYLDLEAAIQYLRGPEEESTSEPRPARPLGVIGASLGGMIGALGSAEGEVVQALVLLSPGPSPAFVEAVAMQPERATLLVAAEGDRTATAGAEAMIAELDKSRSEVVVYPGQAHGTALLAEAPALTPLLVRWLGAAFKDARGL
jgi:pimeloyl-ACP methyl ester carboxylesterase